MSILHSSARPSGASRRSREALLAARRGPVVHRATIVCAAGRVLCILLTDVTRLNFFEVARAAFFSKYYSPRQEVRSVARAGLVH